MEIRNADAYSRCWWITWENGSQASIGPCDLDEAKRRAVEKGPVRVIDCLPYPADPRLDKEREGWDHTQGQMPSFCYRPRQCCGRTACPQPYSCTE